MTTFLNKLRTVTLGTAHDLLDKVVDMNSPAVVRQYVRDLEDAIGKLRSEEATEDGNIRTLTREKNDLDAKITTDKATITKLLERNEKTVAQSKAAVVLQNQKRSDQIAEDVKSQTTALAALHAKVEALQGKHELMVARVRELERLDRDSKAKESAAKALANAGSIINQGSDISVDDLESKMRSRNDVASAKFDQALGDIKTDTPDSDDVNALLESLTPIVK